MSDIPIKKSRGKKYIGGSSPIVPSYVVGDAPPPNNPPGSGGIGDFVTLDTDQTITGEKTFDNSLLIHSGPNPILRIKATSNQSTLNFRNFTNEDQAGIILDAPSSKLSIVTRTDNSDIEIEPHGTGSIILPNVAIGTPVSNLGLDVDNKLVTSSAVIQSSSVFTPTLSANGLSFTYTVQNGYCTKIGTLVFYRIQINFSATGTPAGGGLKISGMPSGFRGAPNEFQYLQVDKFQNSGYTDAEVSLLVGEINGNADGITIVEKNSAFAVLTTYTSCGIDISGCISTSL